MRKRKTNFEKFHSELDLPFLETDSKLIREILQTLESEFGLENNSKQKFIDLGAGSGSVVIFTTLNYNIKSYGIEINQELVNEAKSRIKSLKKEGKYNKKLLRKIKIKIGDFYLLDLKDYDFIYIYSLPSMHKFLKHVFNTSKKGAIVISHKYRLEGISSLLEIEYRLKHEKAKQKIYSFIYRKI